MKQLLFFIYLFIQLACAFTGKTEENSINGENFHEGENKSNDKIDFQDINEPKINFIEGNNVEGTLTKARENFSPESVPKSDLTPYEEIFIKRKIEVLESNKEISSSLSELLTKLKNSNNWKRKMSNILNDENAPASEKYKNASMMLKSTLADKFVAYTIMLEASIEGSQEALGEVAWALLFGNYIPQDVQLAKEIFELLSKEGDAEGHTGMAFLYTIGLGVPFDQRRSLIHFTVAALGGSSWARMALGYRYLYGLSVLSDCEKALKYYTLVAEHVASEYQPYGGTMIQRISLFDEAEDNNFRGGRIAADLKDYYELLAEKGDLPAQIGLGQMYYRGANGLPRDLKKALHYFNLAAAKENPVGIAFIGKIYLEGGENVEVDLPNAYKYLKKAADLGNAAGEAGLGVMYLEGKFVEKDYKKALLFFGKSANKGWVEGLIELAKMNYFGLGMERDLNSAKKYFLMAGQSGHVLSFYYLGKMHAEGIGTWRSCMTAVELLKVVSERGKWGNLFMEGYRMFKENKYKEAFVIYALLAEMGYLIGQSNAAFILDENEINLPMYHKTRFQETGTQEWVRQRKAIQYWSRSALQGYSRAILKIGDHHYYGLGTDVNYEAASLYYKFAAERHQNPQAMFNMGYMHEHGLGFKMDTNLARRFYDMAIEASDEAWIPVGLALIKLNLIESFSFITEGGWSRSLKLTTLDDIFGPYWDLCTIMLLLILITRMVYFRIFHRELFQDIMNWQLFL